MFLKLRLWYNCAVKILSGEMAEWLKAPVSKTGIGETLSRVQIPLSPLRVLLEVWPSGLRRTLGKRVE